MINWYKDRVVLNCLAGSHENAVDIYRAANGHALVGVLSANYPDVNSAVEDMLVYNQEVEGNLSVGLGGGNPNQWKAVADIAKEVKANHFNQVFSAVGWTRANLGNDEGMVNCLVSPSGTPGLVTISTGPLSSKEEAKANVSVRTAIAMCREMGGSSLKFFPMGGLKVADELREVARACAETGFILEPTGGIDLGNIEEILRIITDAGVQRFVPHVYSSIIDKETGNTRIEDVRKIFEIIDRVLG
ncbi:MAG: oxo-acid lyase [Erysipelotrichaceae bacterium]|nr:oxo-acid lyase [Erysipelotrichaceae bacterium]